ncbi:MAG: hypothetical protein B6I30_07255 [Desulfobacteraceae bacterium 4572_187]|nr:MAG: hypothetical protein B6I30_07255 [Desulfobacteraceae bacterium 4572_187]
MVIDRNRWDNAVQIPPEKFEGFWRERLKTERDILLIVGLGWDPRMTAFTSALKDLGGAGNRDIHLIHYKPSLSFRSEHQEYIDLNLNAFDLLVDSWAVKQAINITTRNSENLYIGDKEIAQYYKDFDFSAYTEILVDLSSLPKSLYFTLLYILVKKSIAHHKFLNVHAIVCQNPKLDSQIVESADDTRFLKGFRGQFGRIGNETIPKIWVPILSKNHSESLKKLRDITTPRDIYPILPFPSKNPREDDDLLIEYSKIFANEWAHFSSMNFIYAAEDDPIDVYQSILKLFDKQQEALKPLGGASFVISGLSSKLSSLGAFMAAFEKDKIAVVHAIGRHEPPESMDKDFWDEEHMTAFKKKLHSIWLTGEPYEL